MDDLLGSFNVNTDQITNDNLIPDSDGCLVFHGLKISKDDIQSISHDACDLPTKSITISDGQPDPPSDESTITDDPTEPESDPTEESSTSVISDDSTEPELDPPEEPTNPDSSISKKLG